MAASSRLPLRAPSSLGLAVLLVCCATASAQSSINVYGRYFKHPGSSKDYFRTYVRMPKEHNSKTTPVAVGVEMTSGFLEKAPLLRNNIIHLEVPNGDGTFFNYTASQHIDFEFPCVGANPFRFVYWDFNFNGHPPIGIYNTPHFDFHFIFDSVEKWWGEEYPPSSQGPCFGGTNETFAKSFIPIPTSCWPGGAKSSVTNVGNYVWGMGSHLFDLGGEEWNPPKIFEYAQIYGQHGGEIAYFEPMFSAAFLMSNKVKGKTWCLSLKNNPTHMRVARVIPTKLCVSNKGGSVKIEYTNFRRVSEGCTGPLLGYYPLGAPNVFPFPPGCSAPVEPKA